MATVRIQDVENHHEASPLLGSDAETINIPPQRKRRIIQLLCAFAFTLMLAGGLQAAGLLQIYESAICDDYYKTHYLEVSKHDRCRIQPVQKELAFVRGFPAAGTSNTRPTGCVLCPTAC